MKRTQIAIARCSECGVWLDASDLKQARNSEGKTIKLCKECISDIKAKEACNDKRNRK